MTRPFKNVVLERPHCKLQLLLDILSSFFIKSPIRSALIMNTLFLMTEEQLVMVCLDFFIAGSQTTSNTLSFALLNMIIHQDIQEQAFKEIRSVLGDRKVPTLEDRCRYASSPCDILKISMDCIVL